MLENFLAVGQQVLILFLLMAVGFVLRKTNLIPAAALGSLTNLTIYVAMPAVLINAFQIELTAERLQILCLAFLISMACMAAYFLISLLCIREKDSGLKRIFVPAAVFSNVGFVGIPLQASLLGAVGVFYGSLYNIAFCLLFWSVGVAYMGGHAGELNLKKILLNPGLIGIYLGLAVFLGQITLPGVLQSSVTHLANLAVPLPMIVVGCQLAGTDLRRVARSGNAWLSAALRLLLLPVLSLGILYLCGLRGDLLVALVIAAASPAAMLVSMLAQRYQLDDQLAAGVISLQTLLSIVTLPLVVAMAQLLA